MSDVLQVACRACGARTSGVRTEFGTLVVPGRDGCPRCGATEWTEVTDGTESSPEAGGDSRAATERAVDPEAARGTETGE